MPHDRHDAATGPVESARRTRHLLLGADLRAYQQEHGAFSEEELAEAHARIFGGGPGEHEPA
ncbi:hypothetical protein V1L54_09290 [Streptomyces sp. TRM 70361]|uniref:hypothetical protein n=1 Tax=Streptomyces sp. TRM 70361 TaxID=3116553 RepID=UPI002E7BAE46|nr:hypothetical protein [Streptomyces sp. TRM 70361]MEE1939608.1 hypothetical protein [Streptomyces sp. TRM 70361]